MRTRTTPLAALVLCFIIQAGLVSAGQEPRPSPAHEDTGTGTASSVTWRRGRTRVELDGFRLDLSNRVQARLSAEPSEIDVPHEPGDDDFELRRVRTGLGGWIGSKRLDYAIEFDWIAERSPLQAAYIDWDVRGDSGFRIRAGQFKVPFGRQRIASSADQQFVDRSIVSSELTRGLDLGLQVWGRLDEERFEYRLGLFNGRGRNRWGDSRPLYVARVAFQPWGRMSYDERDFTPTPRTRVAIGGGVQHRAATTDGSAATSVGADVAVRLGMWSAFAEVLHRASTTEGFDERVLGAHGQAGRFLIRERLELAGRLARWTGREDGDADERNEIGSAVSYFFDRKRLMLQADIRRVARPFRSRVDYELRTQFQVIF